MKRWTQFFVYRGSGYWQKIDQGWDIQDEGLPLSAQQHQPVYAATYTVGWWDEPGRTNPPGTWSGKWVNAVANGIVSSQSPQTDGSSPQMLPPPSPLRRRITATPPSTPPTNATVNIVTQTETTTSTKNAIAGAIVGGLVAGAAGYFFAPTFGERKHSTPDEFERGVSAVVFGMLGAAAGGITGHFASK